MSFVISKVFKDLHYGHRVWTQKLNNELCAHGDTQCACRHLHGHSGAATLTVESNSLNKNGMVCDFKELGFMKDFLNKYFDHRFVLDINDPAFQRIVGRNFSIAEMNPVFMSNQVVGYEFSQSTLDSIEDDAELEVAEGFFFVTFVPTSENIVMYLYDIANYVLSPYGISVKECRWNETEKSEAVYTGQ
jgi:6-pyruvoyl-tetrahydropterin synthase